MSEPASPTGPPPRDRSPLGRARSLARGLVTTLRLSTALVKSGRAVDLTGLDASVGLLCARALDLDPEDGKRLLSDLTTVIAELATLSETLARSQSPTP